MSRYNENWAKAKSVAEAKNLAVVEHGWEQHVIIDTRNNFVYRYPKSKSGLAKLHDEIFIIRQLEKILWDIKIPRLLDFDGKRAKYELVAGSVLDNELLSRLSAPKLRELGLELGRFLAKLHSCPTSIVKHKDWIQKGGLLEYYERHILAANTDNPWQEKSMKAIAKLKKLDSDNATSVPVHGDLHGLNIVVDPKSYQLNGVIDFSEVEIGDRHQDLRKIYTTDARLLGPTITGYLEASGIQLSKELIIQWAHTNEWSNACRFADQPHNATYQRAIANLQRWRQLS